MIISVINGVIHFKSNTQYKVGLKMRFVLVLIAIFLATPAFPEDISLCTEGWQKTEAGQHEEAIALFNNCIATGDLTDASLARAYREIGIATERSGQLKTSITYYNLALSLNPADPWEAYVNRGNAWSEIGVYEYALNDYNKALSLNSNYGEAYYNKALLFEKKGNTRKALEEFQKAYDNGVRTKLLHERFLEHGLIAGQ